MASPRQIESLERKHRENPEGLIFAPLANAYRNTGQPERALELLMEGLELHPDHAPARIVLGRCHLDLGNSSAAEEAFTKVLELDPENVIALKSLADITEQAGRYDDSTRWLNILLEVDRNNEEAREQLSRVEQAIAMAPPSPLPEAETSAEAEPEEWPEPAGSDVADGASEESTWAASDDGEGQAAAGDEQESWAATEQESEDGPPQPEDLHPSPWEPPQLADNAEEQASMGWDQPLSDRAGRQDSESESPWAPEGPVPPAEGDEGLEPALDSNADQETSDYGFGSDDLGITIEREEDIVLHASDRSEFQTPDAAGQLRSDSDEATDVEGDEVGALGGDYQGEAEETDESEGSLAGFEATGWDAGAADESDATDTVAGLESWGTVGPQEEEPEAWSETEPDTGTEETEVEADQPRSETPESPPAWSWAEAEDAEDGESEPEFGGEPVELAAPESAAPMPPFEEDARYDEVPAAASAEEYPGEPLEEEFEEAAPEADAGDLVDTESEPEIVATETMAELYLSQGHRVEALEVYRILVRQSPDDSRFRERIEALENEEELAPSAAGEDAVAEEPTDSRTEALAASSTGGQSARQLFASLISAASSTAAGESDSERPPQESESGTDEAEEGSRGAPTRPAQDRLSLSAVFGEDASPVPPAVGSVERSGGEAFSFDSFFGEGKRPKASSAGKGSEDDDLDQFNDWLQGLKG